MTIVVGYLPTDRGRAALDAALEEALRRDTDLVVVQPHPKRKQSQKALAHLEAEQLTLSQSGVRYDLRELTPDSDPADVILDTARERSADLIVLGLRRRTPVGKMIMASTAQRVLLESPCPVLCVKGSYD